MPEEPLRINRSAGNSGSLASVEEVWSRESLLRDAADVGPDAEAEVGRVARRWLPSPLRAAAPSTETLPFSIAESVGR